jgi:hypothetical protein
VVKAWRCTVRRQAQGVPSLSRDETGDAPRGQASKRNPFQVRAAPDPRPPVTRTSGCGVVASRCGVAIRTASWENVQIHDRDTPEAGDGLRFMAGWAGLDSSAADPGAALA